MSASTRSKGQNWEGTGQVPTHLRKAPVTPAGCHLSGAATEFLPLVFFLPTGEGTGSAV